MADAGVENPEWDARVIAAHILNRPLSQLTGDISFSALEEENFFSFTERRIKGEPLQYITGNWDFYGRTFQLSPSVLIPRPETEQMIDIILEREFPREPVILDAGTGSGAIGITLALEIPGATVVATDVSQKALAQATENAELLGASDYLTVSCHLAAPLKGPFDLIAANLPYIPAGEIRTLQKEIRDHEPVLALDGGEDGTLLILELVKCASKLLGAGGFIILETGYEQKTAVTGFFSHELWTGIRAHKDLAGRHRFVSAVRR